MTELPRASCLHEHAVWTRAWQTITWASVRSDLQNILLDTHTADAVHIDLGIAFEQVGTGAAGEGLVERGCCGGAAHSIRLAAWHG